MKKVLYISNIEVPYRTTLFNELAQNCELAVLYERNRSGNRDSRWAESVQRNYTVSYLNGIKIGLENSFSMRIFKYIFGKYDSIIVGCYNSPVQMLAIIVMRLFRKAYILNVDGEQFIDTTVKGKLKKLFLRGAARYLVAGEKCAESIKKIVGDKEVIPYYFSSLSSEELEEHEKLGANAKRSNYVLVIGQYFDYKGLDVAVEAAEMTPEVQYKFVGMGNRTEMFVQQTGADKLKNIEVIPFLQKSNLEMEYLKCALMVLPSRQECWGLVVNEAASFGTPIVSTWGSGAAVEFLSEKYPQYLAEPGNPMSLSECIKYALENISDIEYKEYLLKKSQNYSLQKNLRAHWNAIDLM